MHLVLQIPEVLLNIFGHLAPSGLSEEDRKSVDSDLAALARTCRTFKEPALDILWSELNDPSPLILCLPGAFSKFPVPIRNSWDHLVKRREAYSLTLKLERAERDILRSYTRRIWCLRDFWRELDWRFVTRTSMDFAPAEPLFPNLRSLHFKSTEEIIPLLLLPLPSLIRLNIDLNLAVDPWMLQDALQSLVEKSPNIKRLVIEGFQRQLVFSKIISDGICGWSNLQTLACPQIPLYVDALVHLSGMPSLTRLTFALSEAFLDWAAPSHSLSFSALDYLKLHAESLDLVSRLLSWTQLPAVTDFTVTVAIYSCPSKEDLTSFMVGIQMAGMDQTIQEFDLNQVHKDLDNIEFRDTDAPLLELDDLRTCMAFRRLRRMNVDLDWNVGLSNDGLQTLVSAWPRLEELLINTGWGWNRPGITPNGLAQLLETCPSLTSVALAIDTRGYTQLPARRFREPVRPSSINVLDSVIERESVDAMAAFFAYIVPRFDLIFTSWGKWSPYCEHWEAVQNQVSESRESGIDEAVVH